MADLHLRIANSEQEFLHASKQGLSHLATFQNLWSTLFQDLDLASRSNTMDNETSKLWSITASRVALASEHLLDLTKQVMSPKSTFFGELESIFAKVDLNDKPSELQSSGRRDSTTPTPDSFPSYIESAYVWLLNNLHDPYPPKEARESIARKTGSERKAIDAWFVDARKRIGWNALRKQRFSNKRVDIIDAATRFFRHHDDKRPLDVNLEIELAAIENRAKDLYSDKFTESALALKLDVTVKDLTSETKAQAKEERRRREQKQCTSSQSERDALAALSYPSPTYSPIRTPELSASSSSLQEEIPGTIFTRPIAGQKRRGMSADFDEGEASPSADKPTKRSRLEVQTPVPMIGLPSPALSVQETLEENASAPLGPVKSALVSLTSSRKRRLSDADGQGTPKRPRNLLPRPRMYAVSDPLPMSSTLFEASSMDAWFQANFGIPNAPHIDELDTTLPLDVEVFEYSIMDRAVERTTPIGHAEPEVQLHSLKKAVPPLVVDETTDDFDSDVCTDALDSDLLQFLDTLPQFSEQNIISQPQDASILMFQPPSVDQLPQNPALDIREPLTPSSSTGYDWLLQPHQHLPSSMFNPCLMGFDPLDSSFGPLSQMFSQADKAAKQRKLEEIRAEARRLEAEIASS